jgi:hypothetical protein
LYTQEQPHDLRNETMHKPFFEDNFVEEVEGYFPPRSGFSVDGKKISRLIMSLNLISIFEDGTRRFVAP